MTRLRSGACPWPFLADLSLDPLWLPLKLYKAQSRSCAFTLGPKVSFAGRLGALGHYLCRDSGASRHQRPEMQSFRNVVGSSFVYGHKNMKGPFRIMCL